MSSPQFNKYVFHKDRETQHILATTAEALHGGPVNWASFDPDRYHATTGIKPVWHVSDEFFDMLLKGEEGIWSDSK